MTINCYGTFLFTKYLHPLLVSTTRSSSVRGSVRVIWTTSVVVHLQAPPGGLDLDNLSYTKKKESDGMKYAISKAAVLFVAAEWARRDAADGVLHLVRTKLPGYKSRRGCNDMHG
jgi:retinol dehydrogenase 12